MKDKMLRRLSAIVIAMAMVLPMIPAVFADAEPADPAEPKKETSAQSIDEANRARTYGTYYDTHANDPRPADEVTVMGKDCVEWSEETGAYIGDGADGAGEVLFWPEASGEVRSRLIPRKESRCPKSGWVPRARLSTMKPETAPDSEKTFTTTR